jgi:hypothetical protein
VKTKVSRTLGVALSVGTLSLAAVVYFTDTTRAARYCAQIGDGTRDCGYSSMRQCHASSRNCFRIPNYHHVARHASWSVGYGNYSTHRGVSHSY